MSIPLSAPPIDVAPGRFSGVVYAALLNHAPELAALGDAVRQPPYKAPPQRPVLALRPRNTLAYDDAAPLALPPDCATLQLGVSLAAVIGRTACRLSEADALHAVSGYTVVADLWLPHDSHYRPALRWHARDGFCRVSSAVRAAPQADSQNSPDSTHSAAPADAVGALPFTVHTHDGQLLQQGDTGQRVRPLARLLAEVTDFMTLQPGDLLLLGCSWPPLALPAGQSVRVQIAGIGSLTVRTTVATQERA